MSGGSHSYDINRYALCNHDADNLLESTGDVLNMIVIWMSNTILIVNNRFPIVDQDTCKLIDGLRTEIAEKG